MHKYHIFTHIGCKVLQSHTKQLSKTTGRLWSDSCLEKLQHLAVSLAFILTTCFASTKEPCKYVPSWLGKAVSTYSSLISHGFIQL